MSVQVVLFTVRLASLYELLAGLARYGYDSVNIDRRRNFTVDRTVCFM